MDEVVDFVVAGGDVLVRTGGVVVVLSTGSGRLILGYF